MSLSFLWELSTVTTIVMVILTVDNYLHSGDDEIGSERWDRLPRADSTGQSPCLWPGHFIICSQVTRTRDNCAETPVSLLSNGDLGVFITMLLCKKRNVKVVWTFCRVIGADSLWWHEESFPRDPWVLVHFQPDLKLTICKHCLMRIWQEPLNLSHS